MMKNKAMCFVPCSYPDDRLNNEEDFDNYRAFMKSLNLTGPPDPVELDILAVPTLDVVMSGVIILRHLLLT